MYTILIDGNPLYAPNLANEGYGVIEPKLTMELNKAGSLEFTVPPDNLQYDNIKKLKSIVQVFDENEEIFRGRILHDEKDFYNRRAVYCEGDLSFLLDSIQRVYDYQGTLEGLFRQYISNHNSQVESTKDFTVGQVTVTDKNDYVHYSSSEYPNTLDEISAKLIETHGGYIRTRLENGVRYIDYISDYTNINSQVIEFGVNMLDITEYISADDVFTVLIPLGAEDDKGAKLTIKSVNNNKDYLVNDTAVSLFGYIWKINEWEDVTVASNLKTKGQAFLDNGVSMAVTLTLKAVDLHLMNVFTERIHLGDYVRVLSPPHGLDKYFQCSTIELDLTNPSNSEYSFGVNLKAMTDNQVDASKGASNIEEKITNTNISLIKVEAKLDESIAEVLNSMVSDEEFEVYKAEVNTRFTSAESRITALEGRMTSLEERVSALEG